MSRVPTATGSTGARTITGARTPVSGVRAFGSDVVSVASAENPAENGVDVLGVIAKIKQGG